MPDIQIHYYDDVHIRIQTDRSILSELSEFFTFNVPGACFTPKFKAKQWDGKIRLLNRNTHKLYAGLEDMVLKFADMNDYTIKSFDKKHSSVDDKTIDKFLEALDIHSNGKKINFRDYQISAIKHSINESRCINLSPTSSGKSACIYALIRYYQATTKGKILIIVPNVSLVTQLYKDFIDYSSEVSWNAEANVHCISAGANKETPKDIIISTWQSLQRQPKSYFGRNGIDVKTYIVDEVHLSAAKSLTSIAEKLTDCPRKFGFTGSVQDAKCDSLVLSGLFGPINKVITTKELMERKEVATLHTNLLQLVYTNEEKKNMVGVKYQDEKAWILAHERRNDFIARLAVAQKRSTLVLFNFIEHGEALFKKIQTLTKDSNRKIHYVSGKVGADDREDIRGWVENDKISIDIYFDSIKINLNRNDKVLLNTGETILASDVTLDSDINENWILNEKHKSKGTCVAYEAV